MEFKEVCSKVNKICTKISIIGAITGALILGYSFFWGGSGVNQSLYIDTVKGIELQGQSVEEIAFDIIHTKTLYKGEIEWDIIGSTEEGEVVRASAAGIEIDFFTQKNGDYIQLNAGDVIINDGNIKESLAQIYLNEAFSNSGW